MKAYKAILEKYKGEDAFIEGKTYKRECTGRGMNNGGSGGFYAAEDPLFCLEFHLPGQGGHYHEVELSGVVDTSGISDEKYTTWDYTEVAASTITIGRELSVEEMVWQSFLYRKDWCLVKTTGNCKGERTLTVSSARTVKAEGKKSVAINLAKNGKASVCDIRGAAVVQGEGGTAAALGYGCLAAALGKDCKAKGIRGTWLLLTDRKTYPEGEKYQRTKAIRIDGTTYKENTAYYLERGQIKH